jgi:hypothetical protein
MTFKTEGLLSMDRRWFLGAAAVSAGMAATGGLATAAKAAVLARAPVVAVHMDMPFVDLTGTHRPYLPPQNYAGDQNLDPHFHL